MLGGGGDRLLLAHEVLHHGRRGRSLLLLLLLLLLGNLEWVVQVFFKSLKELDGIVHRVGKAFSYFLRQAPAEDVDRDKGGWARLRGYAELCDHGMYYPSPRAGAQPARRASMHALLATRVKRGSPLGVALTPCKATPGWGRPY